MTAPWKWQDENPKSPARKSGFEDDTEPMIKPCISMQHDPPGHMVIPAGKVYRHVCPSCGYEVVIRTPFIHLGV